MSRWDQPLDSRVAAKLGNLLGLFVGVGIVCVLSDVGWASDVGWVCVWERATPQHFAVCASRLSGEVVVYRNDGGAR